MVPVVGRPVQALLCGLRDQLAKASECCQRLSFDAVDGRYPSERLLAEVTQLDRWYSTIASEFRTLEARLAEMKPEEEAAVAEKPRPPEFAAFVPDPPKQAEPPTGAGPEASDPVAQDAVQMMFQPLKES